MEQRPHLQLPERDPNEARQVPINAPARRIERGELSLAGIEQGDSQGVYKAIATDYFDVMHTAEASNLERAYDNLEQLKNNDVRHSVSIDYEQEPDLTMYVPIAIHNESLQSLQKTLDVALKQTIAPSSEIILYANYPSSLSDEEKRAAQSKLDLLIESTLHGQKDSNGNLVKSGQPDIALRSVVREYAPEALSISQVRKDCLDMIALETLQRGFRFDHPVLALDADMEQASKTAGEVLAQEVTGTDKAAVMAHASTYLVPTADSEPVIKQLVTAHELFRGIYSDHEADESHERFAYREEWGTVLSLGACLMAGSINTSFPANENFLLYQRLKDMEGAYRHAISIAKPTATDALIDPIVIKKARFGASGRRLEDYIRNLFVIHPSTLVSTIESVVENVDNNQRPIAARLMHNGGQYGYTNFSHTDNLRVGKGASPEALDNPVNVALVADYLFGLERFGGREHPRNEAERDEAERRQRLIQIMLGRLGLTADPERVHAVKEYMKQKRQ